MHDFFIALVCYVCCKRYGYHQFLPMKFVNNDIKIKGVSQQMIEKAVINELNGFSGVYLAVSSAALALEQGNVPNTPLYRSVLNNFYAKRSGNIYVVFKPNWFINDFDGLKVASTHGSPWRYDTFVPIVFAGAGLKKNSVTRAVKTIDVAPTLSAFVGAKPPSGASGNILSELFE